MIEIRNAQGDTLHLPTGQTVTTESSSGWLTDDELPGAFSYPISFPLTENNRKFLAYGYRPDSARPDMEFEVTVRQEGVLYRRCTFSYRTVDGKGDGFLKIDSGEVYEALRKKTLLEAFPDIIDLGKIAVSAADEAVRPLASRMEAVTQLAPGSYPFTFFPVRNELFFEEELDDTKLKGFVRQPYMNAWSMPKAVPQATVDTPTTYKMDNTNLEQPTTVLDQPAKLGYPVVPFFYLSWVLNKIMNQAGYRIESDWLAREDVQRRVIFNTTAITSVPITYLNENHFNIKAGLHLPDMTVSDFLKAIRARFGLIFVFDGNSKICQIRCFNDVLLDAAQDLTPFLSGTYGVDAPDGRGFSVSDALDDQDEMYRDPTTQGVLKPVSLVVGKGQQDVQLRAGTTQMVYEASPFSAGAVWTIPSVRQAGNMLDYSYSVSGRAPDPDGKRRNNVGLRLLTYRGYTKDSRGNRYPLGSNDVRDGQQVVVGKQSTALLGPYGIWRTGLYQFYFFRDQTQRVSARLLMPASVFAQLRPDRPIALKLEDQIRRTYLIDKIQGEATGLSGRVSVRLECLSLPAGLDQPSLSVTTPIWVAFDIPVVVETVGKKGKPVNVLSYTLKFYSDKAMTTPVVVTALPVNVRRRKYEAYDVGRANVATAYTTIEESVITYIGTGTSTTIEAHFLANEWSTVDTNVKYNIELSLAPGEEYSIVPDAQFVTIK